MTGEGGQTLRQRKQAATALNIERKAVALVLELGLDAVTVDMICKAAGVSQRTFFNYFKTKDAAILGAVPPRLDETAVRRLLVSDGPLLPDLLTLLMGLAPFDLSDVALAAARLRVIASSPTLLQKEMERMFAVRDEIEEVLVLRLRRDAPPSESEPETRLEASLISHVLAGVLRFSVEHRDSSGAAMPDADAVAGMLGTALRRLMD